MRGCSHVCTHVCSKGEAQSTHMQRREHPGDEKAHSKAGLYSYCTFETRKPFTHRKAITTWTPTWFFGGFMPCRQHLKKHLESHQECDKHPWCRMLAPLTAILVIQAFGLVVERVANEAFHNEPTGVCLDAQDDEKPSRSQLNGQHLCLWLNESLGFGVQGGVKIRGLAVICLKPLYGRENQGLRLSHIAFSI